MSKDIFDLTDMSDLPEELNYKPRKSVTGNLWNLFKMTDKPLTCQQIRAGYYRKYNDILDKAKTSGYISSLIRQGKVVKVEHNLYKRVEK